MARVAFELALLAVAWAAALAVQPWRMLRSPAPVATPLLACLTVLPWLWSLPGLAALPVPLHWSGAPLLVLLVGWPLAVPILTVAGFATMLTSDASFAAALSQTVCSGLVPATLVLLLGQVVRKAFGPNPLAYLLGRAFFVPMLALAGCGFVAAAFGGGLDGRLGELQRVAVVLLSMGEASWTCAVASLLVAYRPQWLATWSDGAYLGRRATHRVVPPRH